jgi:hypothetical protein
MPNPWERLITGLLARRLKLPLGDHSVPEDLVRRFEFREGQKLLVVASKEWSLRLLAGDGRIPDQFGVIQRYGVATEAFCSVLSSMLGPWRANLLFIGDLDPFDLACFRALQVGNPFLRPHRRCRYRVKYAGINSTWIDQCARSIRSPYALRSVCIPMDKYERREWAALSDAWPGVNRVIGRRAVDLLHSGLKLEIEGASNAAFYQQRHLRWVRRHILSVAGAIE